MQSVYGRLLNLDETLQKEGSVLQILYDGLPNIINVVTI